MYREELSTESNLEWADDIGLTGTTASPEQILEALEELQARGVSDEDLIFVHNSYLH